MDKRVSNLYKKFEKLYNWLRKTELNLSLSVKCKFGNVIPKFLRFRLANRSLQSSVTYKQCKLNLSKEKIYYKKSHK